MTFVTQAWTFVTGHDLVPQACDFCHLGSDSQLDTELMLVQVDTELTVKGFASAPRGGGIGTETLRIIVIIVRSYLKLPLQNLKTQLLEPSGPSTHHESCVIVLSPSWPARLSCCVWAVPGPEPEGSDAATRL